jgi:hypothetical protein
VPKRHQVFSNIIEQLGLDWFVLLIGIPAFEENPLPYPTTLKEIRDRLGNLTDKEKLNDAMEYCTILMEREEKRSDKIESKAFTLIGITGTATGFIIGFASLLLGLDKIPSSWALLPVSALYVLVVISLIWTIFLSVNVVLVGAYTYTYPSANDIFDLANTSLQSVQKERIASLFFSFSQNHRVVNRKATYLNGSQLWFRNSMGLLLVLTLLLAVYAPLKMDVPVNDILSIPMTATYTLKPTEVTTITSTSTLTPPTAASKSNYPVLAPSSTTQPKSTISVTPEP